MNEHCPYIEQALRDELKLQGDRWCKSFAILDDKDRFTVLGQMAARRLVNACHRKLSAEAHDEPPVRMLDPELNGTRGPLGHDSGGGKRVIRGTDSMS